MVEVFQGDTFPALEVSGVHDPDAELSVDFGIKKIRKQASRADVFGSLNGSIENKVYFDWNSGDLNVPVGKYRAAIKYRDSYGKEITVGFDLEVKPNVADVEVTLNKLDEVIRIMEEADGDV